MTKDNEMILRVLQARNKKDDREAFDYVEKVLGFKTYKEDGFTIINGEKSLYLRQCYRSENDFIRTYKEGGCYEKHIRRERFDRFDFVNYLKTPRNKAYREVIDDERWYGKGYIPSKYKTAIKEISDYKRYTEYRKKNIEEEKECLNRAVESYTRKIKEHTEAMYRYQIELDKIRKEVGLK